jgi:hypothetical protein
MTDPQRDTIAIVLAVGVALAVNLLVVGFLVEAFVDDSTPVVSDNATTILTTALGGVIGVLAYRLGATHNRRRGGDE